MKRILITSVILLTALYAFGQTEVEKQTFAVYLDRMSQMHDTTPEWSMALYQQATYYGAIMAGSKTGTHQLQTTKSKAENVRRFAAIYGEDEVNRMTVEENVHWNSRHITDGNMLAFVFDDSESHFTSLFDSRNAYAAVSVQYDSDGDTYIVFYVAR